MKQIPLTQGKFALVDDSDFEELNQFKWCVAKMKNTFYVARQCRCPSDGKQHTIFMHRQIMSTPRGMDTDHRNGNGLDNQRSNLRICTHAENCQNRRPCKGCLSRYKGVTWYERDKNWIAQIKPNGKRIYIGYFANEIDAAKAYDAKAIELFGEFANTNFNNRKAG